MRGQAIWNDTMVTASDQTIVVEGNLGEEPRGSPVSTTATTDAIAFGLGAGGRRLVRRRSPATW